jgi:hypothetical protein
VKTLENKELYLLVWDIQKIDNKDAYGHYKEIKEFNDIEEASRYFDEKSIEIYENKHKLQHINNGGTVVKLNDFIKNQGYNYRIVI